MGVFDKIKGIFVKASGEYHEGSPFGLEGARHNLVPHHHVDMRAFKNTVGVSLERAKAMFVDMDKPDCNVLYSPLSLEMALGLLSEGAAGETRRELCEWLKYDEYSQFVRAMLDRADEFTKTSETLNGYKIAMHIANSIWLNRRYTLRGEFHRVATHAYRAAAETMNFAKPDAVATAINMWCAEKTANMINEIISAESIYDNRALILCNALYFESGWKSPWQVYPGKFTNAAGEVVELQDMMYDTASIYYEVYNAKAFGKAYTDGVRFIGILPDEGFKLADIDLTQLIESETYHYEVDVAMPKFSYDYTCSDLIESLKRQGVSRIFSDKSELSGLVKESDYIGVSEIIQKCRIELDENGTKAAAVTAVGCDDFGGAMFEFKKVHLDRPFYYLILDERAKQVLFIGSINDIPK